ncbi:ATP cone domain-containing protein [Streptococcus moroccensis]|uniref:Anaerobic ribonucleoside-triphosphate reductase n=1 Tax=Streptococcus moroccensis TaxID=1451356 RepID=A0ABT9YQV8_9STRE|nr:ATP cone domain-containing protein [Streptococcus moroccensis]MDQ0222386.1 anaerobic ribonucleoside-triphosphate reductase [Streptococcus moroccensis]
MQITKRNGQVVDFDPDKIYQAILKAAQTVYVLDDKLRYDLAEVTKKVVLDLSEAQAERPTIGMVQSQVEYRLLDAGYFKIAQHYIEYRLQRDLERIGFDDRYAVHLRFEQLR